MRLERVHGLIARLARLVGRALLWQLRYGELVFRSQVAVQDLQETAGLGCKLHVQPELFLAGHGRGLDACAGCSGYLDRINHARIVCARSAWRSRDKSRSR